MFTPLNIYFNKIDEHIEDNNEIKYLSLVLVEENKSATKGKKKYWIKLSIILTYLSYQSKCTLSLPHENVFRG